MILDAKQSTLCTRCADAAEINLDGSWFCRPCFDLVQAAMTEDERFRLGATNLLALLLANQYAIMATLLDTLQATRSLTLTGLAQRLQVTGECLKQMGGAK